MKAVVPLTADQVANLHPIMEAARLLPHGRLIGQVRREDFDGSNASTAGRWLLTVALVPPEAAEAMRTAYLKSTAPRKAKP